MRNTLRSIAVLCLLGSAACATDGITGPPLQPESKPLQSVATKMASAPVEPAGRKMSLLACGGSLRASPDAFPLFVVNGVIQDEPPLDAIDPAEIVEIEVLRGAAAAALHDPRAANGVVLITTR